MLKTIPLFRAAIVSASNQSKVLSIIPLASGTTPRFANIVSARRLFGFRNGRGIP